MSKNGKIKLKTVLQIKSLHASAT